MLVAEIVSPSSRMYERVLKRQAYAGAGVPFYLIVEPLELCPAATLCELHAQEYREAEVSTSGVLRLPAPIGVTVELTGAAPID